MSGKSPKAPKRPKVEQSAFSAFFSSASEDERRAVMEDAMTGAIKDQNKVLSQAKKQPHKKP